MSSKCLIVYAGLLIPSSQLLARGLEKLQAGSDPNTPASEVNPVNPASPSTEGTASQDAEKPAAPSSADKSQRPPGLQKMYAGSSLSWLNLTSDDGGWHSSIGADLEVGHKFYRLMDRFDIFGTFRYRAVDVTVEADQRSYRGIVEAYLFGAKGHMNLKPKLDGFASAELGLAKAALEPADRLFGVDDDLEKSGLDLSIGAGLSYNVLDKFAVGSKLALGTGAFSTIQLGVDLRFQF